MLFAQQPSPADTQLFKSLQVGNMTLQHRIVFPPLTRIRSDDNHVPLSFMAKYYSDRAVVPGTLLISEATAISRAEEGQTNAPGFVLDEQVEAWRTIIGAVHAKGSYFFQQLWAMGRGSDPNHLRERGFPYRSSSTSYMADHDATPRAMTEDEILQTIDDFVATAKRATAAGADGVEIHSAHGYLLDQFLSAVVMLYRMYN